MNISAQMDLGPPLEEAMKRGCRGRCSKKDCKGIRENEARRPFVIAPATDQSYSVERSMGHQTAQKGAAKFRLIERGRLKIYVGPKTPVKQRWQARGGELHIHHLMMFRRGWSRSMKHDIWTREANAVPCDLHYTTHRVSSLSHKDSSSSTQVSTCSRFQQS